MARLPPRAITYAFIAAWIAASTGCSRPSERPVPEGSRTAPASTAAEKPGVKHYQGRGRVVDIDKRGRYIVIRHQEIKGFMDPMTMPFHCASPALAKLVQVGDEVEFTLEETPEGVLLTAIRKLPLR